MTTKLRLRPINKISCSRSFELFPIKMVSTKILACLLFSALTYSTPTKPMGEFDMEEAEAMAPVTPREALANKSNCKSDGDHCSEYELLSNRDAHNCKVKSGGKYYSCDALEQCVSIKNAVKQGLYNGGCYA